MMSMFRGLPPERPVAGIGTCKHEAWEMRLANDHNVIAEEWKIGIPQA